jgi:type I restriction enzyme M protein
LEVHDPELLLAQYQAMQDDMASLRNQLKGILTQALRGEE